MAKNIKCSRCKYLKPRPTGNFVRPRYACEVFICDADKSVYVSEFEIDNVKNCQFYRGTAETAEQEVFKRYIIQGISNILKTILKILSK